jgi:hypothetical protein
MSEIGVMDVVAEECASRARRPRTDCRPSRGRGHEEPLHRDVGSAEREDRHLGRTRPVASRAATVGDARRNAGILAGERSSEAGARRLVDGKGAPEFFGIDLNNQHPMMGSDAPNDVYRLSEPGALVGAEHGDRARSAPEHLPLKPKAHGGHANFTRGPVCTEALAVDCGSSTFFEDRDPGKASGRGESKDDQRLAHAPGVEDTGASSKRRAPI